MNHTTHTTWKSAICSRPIILRRCLLIQSDYIHVITNNTNHTIHTTWKSAICSRPIVLKRCLLIQFDYIHVITITMNHTIHTTWNLAICSRPIVLKRCLHSSMLFGDKSATVIHAPAFANDVVEK